MDGAKESLNARGIFCWLTRPRRILLVLACVWVLNFFDLKYTLMESSRTCFVEMNPIAAWLIRQPDIALVAYKVCLVLLGSSILLAQRHNRLAELGCWFLMATYSGVVLHWGVYYMHMLESLDDPVITFAAAQHWP